ncbi:hypothetical protein QQ045_018219 [Rhodiola kirilowii]
MKRFSKKSNIRSSSKTPEAEKITTQKVKFASLHEEEDYDEAEAAQNPKKTCRISSSKNGEQKFACSKCGKGFQSSKAMCGHMASHSGKEKASSNVVAKQNQKQLVMDSQSDTESGAKRLKRRSRRSKKHNFVADSKDKVEVFNNCSSEDSGVEQEQEEVAICLMMLSRDSANWGGLNSVGDSSENNSVVLEDRSICTKLGRKNGLSFGYDVNEAMEKCGSKKIETLGISGSGCVRNGAKNAEMDVKIRNLRKNKLDEGSKVEPHLSLKKLKSVMDGEGYSQIQRHNMDSYLSKSAMNESYAGGWNQYSNTEMYKRFEHKVLIHSQSHQPFNANVASHKSFSFASASPYESGKKMLGTDKGKCILERDSVNVSDNWKKETHDSLVRSKVFRSNHALGSPKEINCGEVAAHFNRNKSHLHEFIDLNLPAPTEDEEANESMGSY